MKTRSLLLPCLSFAVVAVACSSSAPPTTTDDTVGATSEALSCTPNPFPSSIPGGLPPQLCKAGATCCVGGGRPFDLSNPFEAQLAAWGCDKPGAWTLNTATNEWWFYTVCPGYLGSGTKAGPLHDIVDHTHCDVPYGYHDVKPIWSRFPTSANPCLPIVPNDRVLVVLDPTCSSGCYLKAY